MTDKQPKQYELTDDEQGARMTELLLAQVDKFRELGVHIDVANASIWNAAIFAALATSGGNHVLVAEMMRDHADRIELAGRERAKQPPLN